MTGTGVAQFSAVQSQRDWNQAERSAAGPEG